MMTEAQIIRIMMAAVEAHNTERIAVAMALNEVKPIPCAATLMIMAVERTIDGPISREDFLQYAGAVYDLCLRNMNARKAQA